MAGRNYFALSDRTTSVSPESSDPRVIRSIAVTTEDLVSALEVNRTSNRHAVLRVTPPFNARMRARLHIETADEYDQQPRPVHIEPDTLVSELPPYPRPAETEDELRADPDKRYTVERHHEYHSQAVEKWRKRVPSTLSEQTVIETDAGPVSVDLSFLGKRE